MLLLKIQHKIATEAVGKAEIAWEKAEAAWDPEGTDWAAFDLQSDTHMKLIECRAELARCNREIEIAPMLDHN